MHLPPSVDAMLAISAALEAQLQPVFLKPSFQHQRGAIVPNANAIFEEVCFVSRWYNKSEAARVLSKRRSFMPDGKPSDHDDCAEGRRIRDRETLMRSKDIAFNATGLHRIPVAGCVMNEKGVVMPCHHGASIELPISKYCSVLNNAEDLLNAAETKFMDQCARISTPVLLPDLPELPVHADNINHVGRDVAFLAAMLRLGKRSGYTVIIPEDVHPKLASWGRHVLAALQKQGLIMGEWKEVVERYSQVAVRLAKSSQRSDKAVALAGPAPADAAATRRDVDLADLSCGVVCATNAQKVAVTGFLEPEDGVLLSQAVLEYCNLPLERPTLDRTLLLIARRGSSREIRNLAEVETHLRPFAESLGLEYSAVNMGKLSFCEQVAAASASYIMVGIHGADLANMLFQHADATVIEMYGLGDDNEKKEFYLDGTTAYLQQLAASGRRGVAVRLVNVSECEDGNWMYNSKCHLTLDAPKLISVLRKWLPQHEHTKFKLNRTRLAIDRATRAQELEAERKPKPVPSKAKSAAAQLAERFSSSSFFARLSG